MNCYQQPRHFPALSLLLLSVFFFFPGHMCWRICIDNIINSFRLVHHHQMLKIVLNVHRCVQDPSNYISTQKINLFIYLSRNINMSNISLWQLKSQNCDENYSDDNDDDDDALWSGLQLNMTQSSCHHYLQQLRLMQLDDNGNLVPEFFFFF